MANRHKHLVCSDTEVKNRIIYSACLNSVYVESFLLYGHHHGYIPICVIKKEEEGWNHIFFVLGKNRNMNVTSAKPIFHSLLTHTKYIKRQNTFAWTKMDTIKTISYGLLKHFSVFRGNHMDTIKLCGCVFHPCVHIKYILCMSDPIKVMLHAQIKTEDGLHGGFQAEQMCIAWHKWLELIDMYSQTVLLVVCMVDRILTHQINHCLIKFHIISRWSHNIHTTHNICQMCVWKTTTYWNIKLTF